MKRFLPWLLLTAVILSLCGCAANATAMETTEIRTETEDHPEIRAAETEAAVLEGSLFLKVSSITFSLVGESEDIYLGLIPRELVTWESEDPSVVSVENGVLTATGVGATTVRATYDDCQVECTAGCLAQTQEELDSLGFEVLCQPKRLPPEVALDTPCTYFDNAAIVGDSITYMLLHVENQGDYLGKLLFLTRGGASLNGFVLGYPNVYYQGRETDLEDAIAESQVERMYILIGSNDIASEPQREKIFENWDILLERIREKSPDVEIVMISNIPRYANRQESRGKLFITYNNQIAEYNEKMRQYCRENGCLYLDLYCYVEDHCGRMAQKYNLDGYHFNDEGYLNWIKIMRFSAQYELEGGTLS